MEAFSFLHTLVKRVSAAPIVRTRSHNKCRFWVALHLVEKI